MNWDSTNCSQFTDYCSGETISVGTIKLDNLNSFFNDYSINLGQHYRKGYGHECSDGRLHLRLD